MAQPVRPQAGRPDVVVLAPAWESSGVVDLLGEARVAELGRQLLTRATRWANDAFGADVVTTVTGAAGVGAAEAFSVALERARPGRPLVVVVPELAVWRSPNGAALLDDLADGCALSLGAVFDGGFYALALAEPHPALLEIPAETWSDRHALAAVFEVAAQADLLVGMVRSERALRQPGDVSALLADPLLDEELRALLAS